MRRNVVYQLNEQRLDQIQDVLLLDERHLYVELGELGLSVGTQVLIAEAARDLVVAVKPRYHQQLLELLWRLWQRIELTRMDAAGHDIVACSLWRALDQDRRLDLDEPSLVQKAAHERDHVVSQLEVALHPRTPQVEVTVLQPQQLAHFTVAVDVKGWRLGRIQDHELVHGDLNLTRGDARVDLIRCARAHVPLDLHDVLVARLLRRGMCLLVLGIADYLHQPGAVTQIDKD